MAEYWQGWPDKCPYLEDLNWASALAIKYLIKLAPVYKENKRIGIVVFDLDDTLFYGDPEDTVGVQEMSLGKHKGKDGSIQDSFILPVNKPIKAIALKARELGFKIVCLTARPLESEVASRHNLWLFDIPYDSVIMNPHENDYWFKVKVRRDLCSKPNQDIVCTIGDRFTDCYLPGGNTCVVKLPEDISKCSYVYIP